MSAKTVTCRSRGCWTVVVPPATHCPKHTGKASDQRKAKKQRTPEEKAAWQKKLAEMEQHRMENWERVKREQKRDAQARKATAAVVAETDAFYKRIGGYLS